MGDKGMTTYQGEKYIGGSIGCGHECAGYKEKNEQPR